MNARPELVTRIVWGVVIPMAILWAVFTAAELTTPAAHTHTHTVVLVPVGPGGQ